jgi:hypothetical protein
LSQNPLCDKEVGGEEVRKNGLTEEMLSLIIATSPSEEAGASADRSV